MRSWFLVLVAVMGCESTPSLELSHLSTMENETRGLVLHDDGQHGHAAMWETTCEFDTLNGWIVSDADLPTDTEVIEDAYQGEALGQSSEGIHFVGDPDADVAISGVVASRMLQGGTAILRVSPYGDCQARIGDTVVTVGTSLCDVGVSMDTDRVGTLFVADGDAVVSIDASGETTIDGAADLVVRDPVTELLYVAQEGGTEVRAIDRDGAISWTAEVAGRIRAMDDVGRRAMVAVLIATSEGGEIVVLDGWTGEVRVRHETPTADADITISGDGTTLAVVLETQVFFYDVIAEDEEPKQRLTLGSEMNVFAD